MNSVITGDQVGGIVRAVLAAAGGWAIGKGYVDSATATTVSGAVVTLAVTIWSWWTNQQTAMIKSVNNADNGVKVVPEMSSTPKVDAPLK